MFSGNVSKTEDRAEKHNTFTYNQMEFLWIIRIIFVGLCWTFLARLLKRLYFSIYAYKLVRQKDYMVIRHLTIQSCEVNLKDLTGQICAIWFSRNIFCTKLWWDLFISADWKATNTNLGPLRLKILLAVSNCILKSLHPVHIYTGVQE